MNSHPVLRARRNVNLYFLTWVIVAALYFILLYFGLKVNFETALTDSFVFNLLFSGIGLSFWYSVQFIPFDETNILKVILTHVAGSLAVSLLWLIIGYLVISYFIDNYSIFFFNTIAWRALIGVLVYFLTTAFYYIMTYYNESRERAINESELKNLITEAELKSLKLQINPHFIFNSLNSISALTVIDPDKAREMILKLSDYFRYTLSNNERQKNKLEEELRLVRLYLDIEKIRFEEKFEYVEEITSSCMNVLIPNMTLQPLAENAIKHAVYDTLEPITIKFTCTDQNDFLVITFENNYEPGQLGGSKKNTGIGLKNIQNRLKIFYGRDDLVEIKKEGDIFKVILYIPMEK